MSEVINYHHTAAQIPSQASSDVEMVALWLSSFRAATTRRGYAGDIREFGAFVSRPLGSIMLRDIQAYAATLDHLAPITQARRLSAVKSLVGFAHRLGYLPFDVGAPVQLPAVRDGLAERIMSEEQTLKLLGAVRRPRDAALVRLIYYAGLRISEAATLRWSNFTQREGGEAQLGIMGKGGKTRPILLPAHIWARVEALRGRAGPDDPVFRSRKSGPLQARQVHDIVKAAAKRAGLSPKVSAHWLRHAHVSHALSRGAPVHVVRETVGHASLETTTKYSHARPGDSSARYLAI